MLDSRINYRGIACRSFHGNLKVSVNTQRVYPTTFEAVVIECPLKFLASVVFLRFLC